MKNLILLILLMAVCYLMNSFYAEYCISRDCNIYIILGVGLVVLILDILIFKYAYKLLNNLLKL